MTDKEKIKKLQKTLRELKKETKKKLENAEETNQFLESVVQGYENTLNLGDSERLFQESMLKAYEKTVDLGKQELISAYDTISAFERIGELSRDELMEMRSEVERLKTGNISLGREIGVILNEDSDNEDKILQEFEAIHKRSGDDFYIDLFKILVNLTFTREKAEFYWNEILKHMNSLNIKVGRKIGFRVSLLDYFININKFLRNPKIIELRFYERTMKYALIDELTGVYNRKYLDICLSSELNRSKRYNEVLTVLLLDIDNFKKFNDTYGHMEADKILEKMGKILKKSCREEDTICRYGGEEFIVICPETNSKGVVVIAERIREFLKEEGNSITVSGGVASYPLDAETEHELLKRADKAMYTSKFNGKNCITIYG